MSTKSTIFLTTRGEHCYYEGNEYDGGFQRVYLEIDPENIKYFDKDDGGLLIGISGDSELAYYLSSINGDKVEKEMKEMKSL